MIDLTEPIDFQAAIDKLASKEISTALSDPEAIDQADAELRDRSIFAARVTNPVLLQAFKDAVNQIVTGKSDHATQLLELSKVADEFGERGLLTNARLKLILRTNTDLVRGYGQWQENQAHADAFPALELIRFGYRKIPRHWLEIWDSARAITPGTTATPSSSGRLVALINDPIWLAISDFGLPWPPFKYNSGMGVVSVDWNDALELGLIQEGDPAPKPKKMGMNSGLKASVAGLSPDLLSVIAQTITGSSLVGLELFANDDDSVNNRSVSEVMEALFA